MSNGYKIGKRYFYNARVQPKIVSSGPSFSSIFYPVYVQVTYKRKSSTFRSNFFPDYVFYRQVPTTNVSEHLIKGVSEDFMAREETAKGLILKESEIIDFIIEQIDGINFSFKNFYPVYNFYSENILGILDRYFSPEAGNDGNFQDFNSDLQFYFFYRQFLNFPAFLNVYQWLLGDGKEVVERFLNINAGLFGVNSISKMIDLIEKVIQREKKVLKGDGFIKT